MDDFNTTSPDQIADDAKQLSQDAVDKARSVASGAKQAANAAVDTGRAYAKDAAAAVGKTIDGAKTRLKQSTDDLTKAINDEPVKAVLITAVVSSLLTALFVSSLRSDRRYF